MLSAVKERFPRAMRVLLTGYADLQAIEDSINHSEVFRYLMKPCEPDVLKETIELAIEAARAGGFSPEPVAPVEPETDTVAAAVPDAASAVDAGDAPGLKLTESGAHAIIEHMTDVLVLSHDEELIQAISKSAVDGGEVRVATTTDEALALLEQHPVGVLVTDAAVDESSVTGLTTTLKQYVPELVTIVASDRSDAHALIDLINHGQVFRFLLKPVQVGQCRIWLNSASRKYEELVENIGASARHRVASVDDAHDEPPSFLTGLLARMEQIKARLGRIGGHRES